MYQKIIPVLPAISLAKTTQFYRDKLGFSVHHFGSSIVVIKNNIELSFTEHAVKSAMPLSEFLIYVTNVEDLYSLYCGMDIVLPGGQMKSIGSKPKEFTVIDNNGHRLRFLQGA